MKNAQDALTRLLRQFGCKPMAAIVEAPARPGTVWARPFTLLRPGLLAWAVVGRYETEKKARQAARRRGLALPDETPTSEHQRAVARKMKGSSE